MYAQIAAASGGRAAGVQRKVHIKCFMPGCGQGFYRTEEELAQPGSFSNKFCKLECAKLFEAVATASGGSLAEALRASPSVVAADDAGRWVHGSVMAARAHDALEIRRAAYDEACARAPAHGSQEASVAFAALQRAEATYNELHQMAMRSAQAPPSLRSGPRPAVRSLSADPEWGAMTGTVPLSVPLFNSSRRLTALGAEGVQDMMARQLRTEASASEKSVARRFAVDRVANEARMAHGPVGGAQTADTGARPLSLSHESGGTRGAYGYDASKIHGIITIKHDEAKLRAAPFRRLAPGEAVHPGYADHVLNGAIAGRAAAVPVKAAGGFLKMSQGNQNLLFFRQVRSTKTLTAFCADGICEALQRAAVAAAEAAAGRDAVAQRAAERHWREWASALAAFQENCVVRYSMVSAPALSADKALKANKLFWNTVNHVINMHHYTIMLGQGKSIFAVEWSQEMEDLAELSDLTFYKVPARTADIWEPRHINMLRASHGMAPVVKAKRPKKPAQPTRPADGGQDFASIMSRMASMSSKQKAALRKKLGVAAPPAPKKKKCELCGSHTHTKAQCARPGGGRYRPPAPRPAVGEPPA